MQQILQRYCQKRRVQAKKKVEREAVRHWWQNERLRGFHFESGFGSKKPRKAESMAQQPRQVTNAILAFRISNDTIQFGLKYRQYKYRINIVSKFDTIFVDIIFKDLAFLTNTSNFDINFNINI